MKIISTKDLIEINGGAKNYPCIIALKPLVSIANGERGFGDDKWAPLHIVSAVQKCGKLNDKDFSDSWEAAFQTSDPYQYFRSY